MDLELVKAGAGCYFVRLKKYPTRKGDDSYEYCDRDLAVWDHYHKRQAIIDNEEEAQALYNKVRDYLNPTVLRKETIYD